MIGRYFSITLKWVLLMTEPWKMFLLSPHRDPMIRLKSKSLRIHFKIFLSHLFIIWRWTYPCLCGCVYMCVISQNSSKDRGKHANVFVFVFGQYFLSVGLESPVHPCLVPPFLPPQTPPSQENQQAAAPPLRLPAPQSLTKALWLGQTQLVEDLLLCAYRVFKSPPLEQPCGF